MSSRKKLLKSFLYPALLGVVAATMGGCILNSSSKGSGLTQEGSSSAYTVSGDKLLVQSTSYSCASLTGVLQTKTVVDTTPFTINGNVLTLYVDTYNYSATLVIQQMIILNRVGEGSGLQGSWAISDFSYQKVSGTLDTASKRELDAQRASDIAHLAYGTQEYVFSADNVSGYQDVRLAEEFVAEWNGRFESDPKYKSYSDSAQYNVSLQVTDKNTVVLKGNVNHETVHLTLSENGDKDFVSDSAAHAAFHFSESTPPKTCVEYYNGDRPVWWNAFLSPNTFTKLAKVGTREDTFKRKFRIFHIIP